MAYSGTLPPTNLNKTVFSKNHLMSHHFGILLRTTQNNYQKQKTKLGTIISNVAVFNTQLSLFHNEAFQSQQ